MKRSARPGRSISSRTPIKRRSWRPYRIWDTRELAPIRIVCKPRMRAYRPGECLELDIPELGIAGKAIILKRQVDPASMTVALELIGETSDKHALLPRPDRNAAADTGAAADRTAEGRDRGLALWRDDAQPARSLRSGDHLRPGRPGSYGKARTAGTARRTTGLALANRPGVDPSDATTWAIFIEGGSGANGLTTGRLTIYRRTISTPPLPSTSATYDVGTGILSGAEQQLGRSASRCRIR